MKYVITGATSFLGQELIRTLAQSGAEVYAVCRTADKLRADVRELCTPIELQLSEYAALPEQITNADVFIHLAWDGTGHEGRNNPEVQQRNVTYTKIAMHAAHTMGCHLFVMAGSQAEYGSTFEPQQEDMECKPFSEYGKAKLQVWKECSALAKELGMKYIHLRIFSLFGEYDHPYTLVMSCIDKMKRNVPIDLSACTQNWNFLYAHDAAEMIRRLCDYGLQTEPFAPGIYNIASDDSRPLKEFMERMRELTLTSSVLHYGAMSSSGNVVSLQPDMTKLHAAIGDVKYHSFDSVIESIIKERRNEGINE